MIPRRWFFAQRELDQMLISHSLPIFLPTRKDKSANSGPTNNSPARDQRPHSYNQAVIRFTTQYRYNFIYPDPTVERPHLRRSLGVILTKKGTTYTANDLSRSPAGGCNGYFHPVTLDTTVEK